MKERWWKLKLHYFEQSDGMSVNLSDDSWESYVEIIDECYVHFDKNTNEIVGYYIGYCVKRIDDHSLKDAIPIDVYKKVVEYFKDYDDKWWQKQVNKRIYYEDFKSDLLYIWLDMKCDAYYECYDGSDSFITTYFDCKTHKIIGYKVIESIKHIKKMEL